MAKTYTSEERAAYKAAKRDESRQMMETAVKALQTSDGWKQWVRTRAAFHKYSFGNQCLIAMQNPDATQVAGFKTWQKLNRQVRKGEKSIAILAPRTFKGTDDATGEEVRRTYFRAVPVFDISQTDGDPLPTIDTGEITGDSHADYLPKLYAFADSIGWKVETGDTGDAGGYAVPSEKRIRLSDSLASPNARVRTLVHELVHALGITYSDIGRAAAEVLTETAAYVACASIGLDTSDVAVPYVAGWQTSADPDTVADMARMVDDCARQVETACGL